jgi:protease YdgD
MPQPWHAILLACGLLMLAPDAPEARDRVARMVTEAEAPAYRAVGRLNVAGNRHCTATLIADRLVLTAAHCLFNARTGRQARPEDIRFVAGQRGETYTALRGVLATAILPGYVFRRLPFGNGVANDLALLHLDAAIGADDAVPLPVGRWDHAGAASIVAFGRDRAYIASLREGCRPQRQTATVVVLDCPVVPGVSGAPVLQPGPQGPALIGVVSAAAREDGSAVTLIVTPEVVEVLKVVLLGAAI